MRHSLFSAILALSPTAFGATLDVPGGFPTIQAAIDAAVPGDEIVVAPGVYAEALDFLGKDILLRSSAGRDVTIIDGAGLGTTILRADSGETLSTTLRGFTVTNGEGALHQTCTSFGPIAGALYIGSHSAISLEDCAFVDNGTTGFLISGSVIYVRNGSLRIDRCLFEGNGLSADGGVIATCGSNFENTLTITRTDFIDNRATFGAVGYLIEIPTLVVTDCTFEGNQAAHAGVFLYESPNFSGWTVDIERCAFTDNTASFGGALNMDFERSPIGQTGLASIRDCEFTENRAGFGGGMLIQSSGSGDVATDPRISIENCVFEGNEASDDCCNTGGYFTECYTDGIVNGDYYGGAADLRTFQGGTIEVVNALVHDNVATLAGGFHLSTCGGGTIRLVNSTIADNGTSGIHVREGLSAILQTNAGVEVVNTIVSGNGAGVPDQVITELDPSPQITFSATYNLVEGGLPGAGNIDADPLFLDAATGVYCLSAGSPAIDAGDNTAVPAGIVSDLDGGARYVDDPATYDTGIGPAPVVDLGAHEFVSGECLLGTNYCGPAVANSVGLSGRLSATGTGVAGEPITLRASDLPPNKVGLFIVSTMQGSSFPAASIGQLCLSPPIGRFNGPGELGLTSLAGELNLAVDTLDLPYPMGVAVQPGETWHFQLWHRDSLGMSNLTDGLSIAFR